MINGLSGRPGSGKTYEAVTSHIIPALKQGRKIVTNIPLNVEWFVNVIGLPCRELIVQIDGGFHNYGGKRFFSQAEHFLQYQDWRNDQGQGVYFFVDECHLAMPKGGTDNQLKEYLSMHRHYGHDIMLLTQNFRKVDNDVRDMVQNCYFCTKLTFLGKDEKYIVKVADGVSRNIVVTHERQYEDKFYPAYKSHTKADGPVTEAVAADIPSMYNHWTFKGAIIMFIIAALLLLSNCSSSKKKQQNKPSQETQAITNAPPQVQQQNASQAPTEARFQRSRQPEPEEEKPAHHPFSNIQLHIVGHYEDYNRRGQRHRTVYFSVSRNGQFLSEITNVDLALAGYNVQVMNDCMVRLRYGERFDTWILCDSPTQSVSTPADRLALRTSE
ncbi:zonular occludens toxin domain-containing protein [Alkalimonas sp. NCh-2]|uniref:zonular occludens toxin domain-containing protein n=1 Tax=Alkalimonas sp. NCh-2 TaxID=3144846 RepID=UPI0031F6620E